MTMAKLAFRSAADTPGHTVHVYVCMVRCKIQASLTGLDLARNRGLEVGSVAGQERRRSSL